MEDGTLEQFFTMGRSHTEIPLVSDQLETNNLVDFGFGDENGRFVWAQYADGTIVGVLHNYWMNCGYDDIITVKKAASPLS